MSKRLIDTKLFEEHWFAEMKPENKLIHFYVLMHCSNSGIWEIDVPSLKKELGLTKVNIDDYIDEVNRDYIKRTGDEIKVSRLRFISEGNKLWLTCYISSQFEKEKNGINPELPVVRGIIAELQKEGLLEFAIKEGYLHLKTDESNPCQGLATHININNNYYSLNKFKKVNNNYNVLENDLIKLYQGVWGSSPPDPEHFRFTDSMIKEFGFEEVEFAFRTAAQYEKKNIAYVSKICRNRRLKAENDRLFAESQKRKQLELKEIMSGNNSGKSFNILEQVYGTGTENRYLKKLQL